MREKRPIAVSTALEPWMPRRGSGQCKRGGSTAGPPALVALIDQGEAGARALALARAIARTEGASLTVYRRDGEFHDSHGHAMSPAGLAARIHYPVPRLIVLAAPVIESDAHALLELCAATPAPLVIVR